MSLSRLLNPARRPLAVALALLCAWYSLGLWNVPAFARSLSASRPIPRPRTAPEKFDEAARASKRLLEQIEHQLAEGKEITAALGSLKARHQQIEAADITIRKEFSLTEGRLKAANLPQEILDRHRQAVSEYDAHFDKLRQNLRAIDQAEDERKDADKRKNQSEARAKRDQLKAQVRDTRKHLEDAVRERPHNPLDPDNLPHRTPKINPRQPRLKKEEFAEFRKPVMLAFSGDPGLLLAQSGEDLPKPEDLAETIEVQLTPEIRALAAQLGHNPVRIHDWVRNNIEFVPTHGSIQGARMCLLTRQCNAADTASLLVALLRASSIAARYVLGTIEVPIDQVKGWVGDFTDAQAAIRLMASAGIPVGSVVAGGTVAAARLEHTWVEAFVDYVPSRGAVHRQGE